MATASSSISPLLTISVSAEKATQKTDEIQHLNRDSEVVVVEKVEIKISPISPG